MTEKPLEERVDALRKKAKESGAEALEKAIEEWQRDPDNVEKRMEVERLSVHWNGR